MKTALILLPATLLLAACSASDPSSASGAPVDFIDLRVEEIAATRAVIRFATSRSTTCEIEYGPAVDTLDQVATDPSMGPNTFVADHEVALEDLSPGTTYYYRARATTREGDAYRSQVSQFTTPEAPDEAAGLVNVALLTAGTSVVAVSSNFGGGGLDSNWGAHRALDGQMATEWATDGDGDDAFIELDFGRERSLRRFGFRSRRMADGSSIVTRVRLLDESGREIGPFATPDPDQFYLFDLEPPVTVRRLRLEAVSSTGGNTGAREIQFFSLPE